jgi:hypothetical protein
MVSRNLPNKMQTSQLNAIRFLAEMFRIALNRECLIVGGNDQDGLSFSATSHRF